MKLSNHHLSQPGAEEAAWRNFVRSGRVADYLAYRACCGSGPQGEEEEVADHDQRGGAAGPGTEQ